mmetsp:Transcript_7564/g.13878  ORF Transcript_7564/g.13878 Transcript_7564/m.13878 type:complete len:225 (-) Transcript_7564:114-788(-)
MHCVINRGVGKCNLTVDPGKKPRKPLWQYNGSYRISHGTKLSLEDLTDLWHEYFFTVRLTKNKALSCCFGNRSCMNMSFNDVANVDQWTEHIECARILSSKNASKYLGGTLNLGGWNGTHYINRINDSEGEARDVVLHELPCGLFAQCLRLFVGTHVGGVHICPVFLGKALLVFMSSFNSSTGRCQDKLGNGSCFTCSTKHVESALHGRSDNRLLVFWNIKWNR